jgi:hypothetical protein
MRRRVYYRRAARQFLSGTRYKAPFEVVEAGLKTLEEWVNLLNLERDLDEINRLERHNRRLRSWLTVQNQGQRSPPTPHFS